MRASRVLPALSIFIAVLAAAVWYVAGRGVRASKDVTADPVAIAWGSERGASLDRARERLDARDDDWEVERLYELASGPLGAIAQAIETGKVDARVLVPFVSEGFRGTALRPPALESVFDDGTFVVRRSPRGPPGEDIASGSDGLARLLRSLSEGLAQGERHVEFKPFAVVPDERRFTVRAYYEAGAHDGLRATQQSATWRFEWVRGEAAGAVALEHLSLEAYEEVEVAAPDGRLFVDATRSAIGGDPSYAQQVLPGIDHWVTRQTRTVGMWIYGHHGIAVGDADGDGLEDLYVCDAGGLPNRLYLQRPDGTAVDQAAESGVDWLEYSSSALFLDLDGDADQDLVVATRPQLLVAENDGTGRFALRSGLLAVEDPLSLAAADYDGDGDLDLYLCVYNPEYGEHAGIPIPIPYHDARNGGANVLLRNAGDFRFEDATEESGLDENNARFSFAAAWGDYDDDGDPDLYVANDFGRNNLYRNDGGHFADVAAEAGVEDIASGMSASWGDYDRDGRLDLYVSNMFSSAGSRVTYGRRFEEGRDALTVASVRRMARGNSLFANAGDGTFRDVSEEAGVMLGRWAWGSRFCDLNNDGWQDLVVANGYFTRDDPHDL